jgi:ADP-heptose:LPS heptosyltransferase
MYQVTFSKTEPAHMHMEPGKSYLMDACNAGQYLITHRPDSVHEVNPDDIAKGESGTLIIRAGGIGDIIQCAGLINALILQNPKEKIDFCCATKFADAIRFHPKIGRVLPYPLEREQAEKYARIISLENAVEFNATDHMADAFLNAAGIDSKTIGDFYKRPEYHMPKRKTTVSPKTGGKLRIGIQAKASARCRTSTRIGDYAYELIKLGYEVYLFGSYKEATCEIEGVVNMCEEDLKLHETAQWMKSCDAMVTMDSGLMHIAGALQIPTIALFSVINADLRVRYTPFTIGIQSRAPCAPCAWHGRGGSFPPHCPSAIKNRCQVLDAISFELVHDSILKVIDAKRKYNKKSVEGIV